MSFTSAHSQTDVDGVKGQSAELSYSGDFSLFAATFFLVSISLSLRLFRLVFDVESDSGGFPISRGKVQYSLASAKLERRSIVSPRGFDGGVERPKPNPRPSLVRVPNLRRELPPRASPHTPVMPSVSGIRQVSFHSRSAAECFLHSPENSSFVTGGIEIFLDGKLSSKKWLSATVLKSEATQPKVDMKTPLFSSEVTDSEL
ncbi:hypothetical protein F0562_031420 [Nyssa sinensis]|uniref:Uncharacterized protein n=1 Tax=Nyssa sinensis TaxID=561372 RepID=A0A5J5ASE3_9ASTE|nr:hypothetical protein F0562_031420 [Nyssa sinensis]